ncbi:T3SS effector HopA1 family protein [Kitasatospora sp. GAS1066B]|uniref:T3SS effector HopA1 family protein n=1 Tax=Kitasatospora sp. GAS1066B TaxID=3156271 RepID=UPI003513EE95
MTAPQTTGLPEQLARAVEQVWIAEDLSAATVGHRELTAEHPRELQRLLSTAMYEVLHAGLDPEPGSIPFHLRDAAFEQVLAAAVPNRTTTVTAQVEEMPVGADGPVLLRREGVRVWTPRERILAPAEPAALTAGQPVAVRAAAARPALSPGFFLVDGERPAAGAGPVLRVYVHLTEPDPGVEVWRAALAFLHDARAGYRAKVVSTRVLYPRRDALVVYLREGSWELATELAAALVGLPGLGADVSLFTRRLAPGIAAAWEPTDPRPGMRGLSFGQHRAGVLAQALIEHRKGGAPLPELVADHFTAARIAVTDPAANSTSPPVLD